MCATPSRTFARRPARGAQIVCLQELFNSLYFCKAQKGERFDLAEPIPGPTTDIMQALARELSVVLIVPLFERQAAGVYRNSAAIIDADGTMLGVYRKMHIPDDPLFYEKYYFTPGDATQDERGTTPGAANGFRVWETRYARIGVLICWDQWYPEAARITSLLGADILFYPTAIGWHPSEKQEFGAAQVDAWRTVQRGHAIANGVYVAAANRVGHEPEPGTDGLEFFGHSFVSDPFGRIIADAGTSPEILIAHVRHGRASRTHDGTGHSCVTGASTRTGRSSSDTSADQARNGPDRMPAEWEPHAATWIAWPHHEPDWPGKLEAIPWVYAEIVRALAPHGAGPRAVPGRRHPGPGADRASPRTASPTARYQLHLVPTDRVWLRDSAPTGVVARRRQRPPWSAGASTRGRNTTTTRRTHASATRSPASPACRSSRPHARTDAGTAVLEGGAIDTNGEGMRDGHRGMPPRRPCRCATPGSPATATSSCSATTSASARRSGSGRGAQATTRTVTSTTSHDSWRRTSWCWRSSPIPADDNHASSEDNLRRLAARGWR